MSDLDRPTGREMLSRIIDEAEASDARPDSRGSLRVYLGFAPGVGKTYAMLLEGRRLQAAGVDVVCGFIEPHGRAETIAQMGDLEVIPRQRIPYRGIVIEEMDTEAILARHPDVCLVDELAHTNAPGSVREKRWEDVELLRDAGIDVVTTVNIQHLEGLNDVISSLTGVVIRETVPDHILADPTVVHLVDLPPTVLRQRLLQGKIYPHAQAHQALEQFFRPANLTALRHIALRQMAAGVETTLEQYMVDSNDEQPAAVAGAVLACIGSGASAGQVLRHAWRLAIGLDTELIGLHVVSQPERTAGKGQQDLDRAIELAEDLGAEVLIATGSNIIETVLTVARQRNVAHIVIGYEPRSRWQEYVGRSLVHTLIRSANGCDVHVVPLGSSARPAR